MIKFDRNRLIFGLFLIILVAIGYLVMEALQVPTWPAFMAMIFFLMAKGDKKTALPILVGGTVGILFLVLAKFFVMGVGPSIGLGTAKLIFILLVVYTIVAFAEIIPIFVNIYSFMFFLIAALATNVPNPNPRMAPFLWIGVLLIGGGLFVLGIMGIYKILTAIVLKKAAKAK
jgi:hypothetical protein